MLIDTHCHLDEEAFRTDLDEVVARAVNAGVARIVTIGTTAASSRAAVEVASRFEAVYAAVGIQPNYVAAAKAGDWEMIEQLAGESKVVAIGETGLDRYWDHTPIELQEDYFERHISLARSRKLPFVVHCREAEADVVRVLRAAAASGSLSGIMHSFCGSSEVAADCVAVGMHVSFAGMLTYKKNDALRATAATIPADRILVETDAPYLAPAPKRGKRNEPSYVTYTAEVLADVCQVSREEIAARTAQNAARLFRF